MAKTQLGGKPPHDGNDWDAQCGRCGSTLSFVPCENCAGEGFTEHDCGEDTCCCADPEYNVACGVCGGDGSFPSCLSSPGWCEANPMKDREHVERSSPEWFVVGEHPEASAH